MATKNKKVVAPPLKIEHKVEDTNTKSKVDNTSKKTASSANDTKEVKEGTFSMAHRSVLEMFEELFPGHPNAGLCGFIGFIVSLLIFIIGFWKTLLIVLLITVGISIGQILDGDPKIINICKELFLNKR